MILSDGEILEAVKNKDIDFEPVPDWGVQLQPASVDLRLGSSFMVYKLSRSYDERVLDIRKRNVSEFMTHIEVTEGERFVLDPDMFALGSTIEKIRLGPQYVGRVDGRSSWGRMGLNIHSTAGFIDPGFEGTITLELSNDGRYPIALYPGDRICQISLHRMGRPALEPYGTKRNSKYQGQTGATASKLHEDLHDQETEAPTGATY